MGERPLRALLVVLQAMDAPPARIRDRACDVGRESAGRGRRRVQQPSSEELDHNFLWRISNALPERGRIGIFNRSHSMRRSSRSRCTPSGSRPSVCCPAIPMRHSATAVRGHQRVRAPPRPERDEDREVLPARLEGGAEEALPCAARHAGQGGNSTRRTSRSALWDDYMRAFDDALMATSTPGRRGT